MQLKRVVLNNFRCFEHLEIDLHPRLTVLVAENGGGKTAVLDAIAIGLSPVLRLLSTANQRLNGPGFKNTDFRLQPVLDLWGKPERWITSDYSQVIMETVDGLKWDHWKPAKSGTEPAEKIGQVELTASIREILNRLDTLNRGVLPVFAYYGARRGWIEVPGRLRTSKNNYSYPTSALEGALEALSDFREMLMWFDAEESSELRLNIGRAEEDFDRSPLLQQVRAAIVLLLHGRYQNPHFTEKHKFVVEEEKTSTLLQASQLSQGYQSMLALGMDFARRLALGNSHLHGAHGPHRVPALMLVDEIDLHLHPKWQQQVLDDLFNAFPETQFIVTTHSPQVLTTLGKNNIRMLACDADGQWTAQKPPISPLGHESGDALAQVMGAHPRPDCPAILPDLHKYEQLARAGQGDSAEARAIKARLDEAGFEFNPAETALFEFLARKAAHTPVV
ncbi:MAG: AAA family ATPase [Candidatus Competibacteraceae bacterium]